MMGEEYESEILFKWTNSCRLCLSSESSIDIFSQEAASQEILRKIRSCLNLLIYCGDPMPRKLCEKCLIKLDDWHRFREECIQTELNLKKRLQPYKKIDFVQDYFEKHAKFTCSEQVSSSSKAIPSISVRSHEEVNSSTSCKVQPDEVFAPENTENSAKLVSSNEYEVNSTEVHDGTYAVSSGTMLLHDGGNGQENDEISQVSEQQSFADEQNAHFLKRTTEWPENEDSSVGTIVSVTGCASALWSYESHPQITQNNYFNSATNSNSDTTTDNIFDIDKIVINIKQEKVSEICPSCKVEFPSTEHLALHSCYVIDGEDEYFDSAVGDVAPEEDEASSESSAKRTLRRSTRQISRVQTYSEQGASEDSKDSLDSMRNRKPCPLVHKIKGWKKNFDMRMTPWKCIPCSIYFQKRQHLKDHYQSARCRTKQIDTVACEYCQRRFLTNSELLQHQIVHVKVNIHLTDDDLICCRRCNRQFANEERLRRHTLMHRKRTPPRLTAKYSCPDCNDAFSRSDLFEKHRLSHQLFNCSLCPQVFSNKQSVDEHKKTHTLRCSRCGSIFENLKELENHRALKHKNPTPWVCRKCGLRFSARSQLLMHQQTHFTNSLPSSPTESTCKICFAKFLLHEDLVSHMKTHDEPKTVEIPEEPESSIRPELRYRCSLCPRMFMKPYSIIRHGQQLHKGQHVFPVRLKKPILINKRKIAAGPRTRFRCTQCPKYFFNRENLNAHTIRTHVQSSRTSTAVEKCSYCHKMFKATYIRFHVKKYHRTQTSTLKSRSVRQKEASESDLTCRYCFRVCSNIHNRKVHESIHEPAKFKVKSTCERCGKKFFNRIFFETHMKKCSGKPLQCSKCPRKFLSLINLRKHTCKSNIEASSLHRCTECLKSFTSLVELQAHSSTAHVGGSPEPQPGASSYSKKEIEREMWREESNKIVCEVGDKFYCTLCDCEFSTVEESNDHMQVHPRGNYYVIQVSESVFQCTICDKAFESRRGSLLHINYHKKNYESDSEDLERINKLGVKRSFKCPLCSSTFASEENIKNHIFYVHPDTNMYQ